MLIGFISKIDRIKYLSLQANTDRIIFLNTIVHLIQGQRADRGRGLVKKVAVRTYTEGGV